MGETSFDVVIVGAGFSGLYMLHRLRQQGLTARVYEAGTGVGGTWYWNRYPGARVDIESQEYSYSFSPELDAEWTWSERYASQPELLAYLNHVADRFDLRRDIQVETRVTAARFDEASGRWTITTDRGETIDARYCVMATGCLSVANDIAFEGADSFQGPTYRTGSWPKEGVDFTGRTVAVIGTGSSAIQSIPMIAAQADHVTVFQRTPNFSVPAHNGPPDPQVVADWAANRARYRAEARETGFGLRMIGEGERPGPGGDARGASRRVRTALGHRRLLAPRRVQRSRLRPDRQRHRRRVRAREDPRHRQGSECRREAGAQDLPDRVEADLRRHRLLRHVQPRQRHPGRPAGRADRGDHAQRRAHRGARIRGGRYSSTPSASTP
jgi:cation diffusion facilitator CzcD-associated flavoprotein CzcO